MDQDIWFLLFDILNGFDVMHLGSTNRFFYGLVRSKRSHYLWAKKCIEENYCLWTSLSNNYDPRIKEPPEYSSEITTREWQQHASIYMLLWMNRVKDDLKSIYYCEHAGHYPDPLPEAEIVNLEMEMKKQICEMKFGNGPFLPKMIEYSNFFEFPYILKKLLLQNYGTIHECYLQIDCFDTYDNNNDGDDDMFRFYYIAWMKPDDILEMWRNYLKICLDEAMSDALYYDGNLDEMVVLASAIKRLVFPEWVPIGTARCPDIDHTIWINCHKKKYEIGKPFETKFAEIAFYEGGGEGEDLLCKLNYEDGDITDSMLLSEWISFRSFKYAVDNEIESESDHDPLSWAREDSDYSNVSSDIDDMEDTRSEDEDFDDEDNTIESEGSDDEEEASDIDTTGVENQMDNMIIDTMRSEDDDIHRALIIDQAKKVIAQRGLALTARTDMQRFQLNRPDDSSINRNAILLNDDSVAIACFPFEPDLHYASFCSKVGVSQGDTAGK